MFVLAAKYANLKGYDHFLNTVILISVLSIGVSCVYGGSRTLTALAQYVLPFTARAVIERPSLALSSSLHPETAC